MEVIIYNSILSLGDQHAMEGYLAGKYGIQTSLPAGIIHKSLTPAHPYFNAPP